MQNTPNVKIPYEISKRTRTTIQCSTWSIMFTLTGQTFSKTANNAGT